MKAAFYLTLLLFAPNAFAHVAELPLRYEQKLISQGFPSPVIELFIHGQKGLFLVDTGASIHVVSDWFAKQAKIKSAAHGTVAGASGGKGNSQFEKVSFYAQAGQGWSANNQWVAIVHLPDAFRENRLAGIISPQQFLTNEKEVCLLNLKKPSLKLVQEDNAALSHGE